MARRGFDLAAYEARARAIPPDVRDAVKTSAEFYANKCAAQVKKNIPKDSGDLAATVLVTDGRTSLSKKVSVGNKEHPYAAAVEFGHMDHGTHVAANPFFFPAVRVAKKNFKSGMSAKVRAAIRAHCVSQVAA